MELFDIQTPQKDRFEWSDRPYERGGGLLLPGSRAVSLHSGWADMYFHYYARPGYTLCMNIYQVRERRRTVATSGEDTLEFTFMLGGSMVNRLGGFAEAEIQPMQYNLSYLSGYESESILEANHFYATLDIHFRKSYVQELALAFPESMEPLMEGMNRREADKLHCHPYFADAFIRGLVEQITVDLRKGDIDWELLDRRVDTLMLHVLSPDNGEIRKVTERGRRQLMNDIYGRLLGELMEMPGVSELQKQYGLSATAMRVLFRETFGETMRDVWVKHRLDRALGMVAYEREKKIKEIGAELGFLSVSNFSKAFINAYGVSPRGVRKDALTMLQSQPFLL